MSLVNYGCCQIKEFFIKRLVVAGPREKSIRLEPLAFPMPPKPSSKHATANDVSVILKEDDWNYL